MNETLAAAVEEFAASRAQRLTEKDSELRPVVEAALDARLAGRRNWAAELATAAGVLWLEIYEETGGQGALGNVDEFVGVLTAHLERTARVPASQRETRAQRITDWISVFTVNNATVAAAQTLDDIGLQWVTMRDSDVRGIHRPLEGQQILPGGTFDVDGTALHYPGEPVGPPEVWIQCRCMAMPIPGGEMSTLTAASDPGETVEVIEAVDDPAVPPEWDEGIEIEVPWHGILAVEDIPTGDLRRFASQALTYATFPLSLTWQKASADAHGGSVVVGRITNAWTGEDGLIYGEGMFRTSPEADEVIDMIANGDLRGVSVELDSVSMEYSDANGDPVDMDLASDADIYRHLTAGRVRSATILPVAAFEESYVALGPWPEQDTVTPSGSVTAACVPCAARQMEEYTASLAGFAISEAAWDGSASRFTDEEWERATVVDRGESYTTAKERYAVPIREPNGDLSRAAVHNAAARIDQVDAPAEEITAAKRRLVAAYRELEQDPPESILASALADGSPDSSIQVGDRVTWNEFIAADEVERTGTIVSIDEDWVATVQPDDGEEEQIPVADLVQIGQDTDDEDEDDSVLAASPPGTRDGPGWITNPDDTQRLRTYWTRGEGAAKIRWGQPGDFNRCRRQLAKYVPNPSYLAGTCANMHYDALGIWPGQHHSGETVTASAQVTERPTTSVKNEWFKDPGLPLPTPLTIVQDTDSGRYRIMGHAAQWGVCHTGLGLSVGQGGCTTAPHSKTEYAYYRTGAVETDQGLVPVGQITMATGHADKDSLYSPAAAHYDNTGTVVADVAAGEDEHGIWVAGVMRPGVTDEQRAELLAATLSGDWRWIGGNLEMVAALAVNTPGFPIPRMGLAASAGRQTSLIAAGVVPPREHVADQDGVPIVASAVDIARELHRLQKADVRQKAAREAIAAVRQGFNSERAARALSVITNGK